MSPHEHLGQHVSALVDGELSHADRERALAHVAHCTACRATLDAERSVKARLAALAAPAPAPDLLARLQQLAEPGEPMTPDRPVMPGGRPRRPVVPPPGRPPSGRRRPRGRVAAPTVRRSHRRLQLAAAGTFSVVAVVMGAAFVAGGAAGGAPVTPAVNQFTIEHAATSDQLPLSDPAYAAVSTTAFGIPAPVTTVSLVPTPLSPGR